MFEVKTGDIKGVIDPKLVKESNLHGKTYSNK